MTASTLILALSLTALGAGSVEQSLKGAIEDFEFGDHAVAAKKLQRLLDPIKLESAEDVILARQYLGACHYLTGKRTNAEAEFSKILALDPQHKLDPEVFSPALVQFFEEVRTRTGLALVGRPDPRTTTTTRPDKPPPRPDPQPNGSTGPNGATGTNNGNGQTTALTRAPAKKPPFALAFIPFGVGQFNNKHPIRGALFGGVEVALLATSIASYAAFQSLGSTRGGQFVVDNEADADKASTLQSLFLATLYSAIGVMVVGVVEAIISYPGDAVATEVAGAPGPGPAATPAPSVEYIPPFALRF